MFRCRGSALTKEVLTSHFNTYMIDIFHSDGIQEPVKLHIHRKAQTHVVQGQHYFLEWRFSALRTTKILAVRCWISPKAKKGPIKECPIWRTVE
jgi:hypothetical protein